jgi:hypothetical protein
MHTSIQPRPRRSTVLKKLYIRRVSCHHADNPSSVCVVSSTGDQVLLDQMLKSATRQVMNMAASTTKEENDEEEEEPQLSIWGAFLLLTGITVITGVTAEFLVSFSRFDLRIRADE